VLYRTHLAMRPAHSLTGVIIFLFLARSLTANDPTGTRTSDSLPEQRAGPEKYMPYHQLVESDFPIDDHAHPEGNIYTSGYFHYRYSFLCESSKGHVLAFVSKWTVDSGFDRTKSSRKAWFHDFAKVLPHEQGHLDINEIFSRRLAKIDLNRLPVGEGSSRNEASNDLAHRLKILAEDVSRDAQAAQNAYDAQTRHGADEKKQNEAAILIEAELREARAADIALERN